MEMPYIAFWQDFQFAVFFLPNSKPGYLGSLPEIGRLIQSASDARASNEQLTP